MFVCLLTLFITYHMLMSFIDAPTGRAAAPTQQPSRHTPFLYVIILFIIMIIMHYYKFYFLCINTVRRRATSNGWPQPQTQYPARRMPFSNGFIRNNY